MRLVTLVRVPIGSLAWPRLALNGGRRHGWRGSEPAQNLDNAPWANSLNRRMLRAPEKGRPMALDTNTFLIVLAAAIVVIGFVAWVMLKKVS
jgi:hypothetical protein